MPPEVMPPEVMPPKFTPPEALSFARRAQPHELAEWMDEPCAYADFCQCLADLATVNQLTLAYRPTVNWLAKHVFATGRPLHIVDVGSGGGDMLRRIARWSQERGVAVRLTGIDLNPYAARAAREFSSSDCPIEWITGDAYSYQPTGGIDLVFSSLFTHHLEDAEIVRFIGWMESTARCGWFINDLRRSRVSYALFNCLANAAHWHRFVQHDGPVSIRRSFSASDWSTLCTRAGLASDAISILPTFPWRLCVGRWK